MKQLLMHVQTGVGFGGATGTFPLLGSSGLTGATISFVPLPWATTIRNLVVISHDATRTQNCTVTLMKNGVATALSVTLASDENGPVMLTGVDVEFSKFDDVTLQFSTPLSTGGNIYAWCIELESIGNVYGCPNTHSSITSATDGGFGGALGNGFQQAYNPPQGLSSTYSICSVAGDITTLVARCYSGAPASGDSWTAYVIVNDVIQDGSGGTVDTRAVIGEGETTADSTFVLPIVPGDIVELGYVRAGSTIPGALSGHVGIGIGFVPDSSGWFMLTGGSNNTLTSPGFVWTFSAQNETVEELASAPVGPGGFHARGLYIIAPAPGSSPDDQVTRTLLRNGADTNIAVVLNQLEGSGSIAGQFVTFLEGHLVTLSNLATGGSPNSSRLFWGLAASIRSDVGITGTIGPYLWVEQGRVVPV